MKKIVLIFSILAGFALIAQAQINTSDLLNLGLSDSNDQKKTKERSESKTTFSQIHGGVNFPLGNFAEGNSLYYPFGDEKGFAEIGFTVGYKLYTRIGAENLSFVFGVDMFYNGLKSDGKDYFKELENYSNVDIVYPKYLNFPATVGLNYAIPVHETVKIYGEGALGANLSTITKMSLSGTDLEDGYKYYDEMKFTPKVGFVFAFEAGVFINDIVSIGVRYNNFGAYKYNYKYEGRSEDGYGKNKGILNRALPISNISLSVGVMF